jgi:hypothetical protein
MTRFDFLTPALLSTLQLAREAAREEAAREVEWQRGRRRRLEAVADFLQHAPPGDGAALLPGWRAMHRAAGARLAALSAALEDDIAAAEARLRVAQKELSVAENLTKAAAAARREDARRAEAASLAEFCATRAGR